MLLGANNNNKKAVLSQRWPRDACNISGSNEPLRRYGHSKLSKMAACRHSIRRPWKPTVEPNMKCIGSPVAEIDITIHISWGIWNPILGKGGRRGSATTPFERAMVVSYRLSIVTVALSVTIRPQFAIECLRRSNQQGAFGPNFPGVPLGAEPWFLGLQRANIPAELTVKLFRKNSNLCDHNPPTSQTDRQTDDMWSQDRACTKVHRAVIIVKF